LEWTNKYNSFNSYKGLTYYENYKAINKWMDGNPYLPAPIECNLDPMAECNLRCYFCITQRYLRTHREEVGEIRKLPRDYMLKLVDFLSVWGVRGLCISGGGEPTLHPDLPELILHAKDKMKVAVVTNTTLITNKLADALMHCRWVAMSVDAGTRETYKEVKGRDYFKRVKANITMLANLREVVGSKVDLCYKFLVLPENQYEIYKACKLAKSLGVQDFHVRPVDFERKDIVGHKQLAIDKDSVFEQFEECHKEETEGFHVYTVTHKFNPDFHVKHDFNKCLATPLVIPILQDGNAYLCVDKKMEADFKIGSCYPYPEKIMDWWGSDAHRQMVKSVDINQCSRCTWSAYNSQCENLEGMCLDFP